MILDNEEDVWMLAGVFDFKSHKMAEDNIHNACDKMQLNI